VNGGHEALERTKLDVMLLCLRGLCDYTTLDGPDPDLIRSKTPVILRISARRDSLGGLLTGAWYSTISHLLAVLLLWHSRLHSRGPTLDTTISHRLLKGVSK
jgi:hypothetical protein